MITSMPKLSKEDRKAIDKEVDQAKKQFSGVTCEHKKKVWDCRDCLAMCLIMGSTQFSQIQGEIISDLVEMWPDRCDVDGCDQPAVYGDPIPDDDNEKGGSYFHCEAHAKELTGLDSVADFAMDDPNASYVCFTDGCGQAATHELVAEPEDRKELRQRCEEHAEECFGSDLSSFALQGHYALRKAALLMKGKLLDLQRLRQQEAAELAAEGGQEEQHETSDS